MMCFATERDITCEVQNKPKGPLDRVLGILYAKVIFTTLSLSVC